MLVCATDGCFGYVPSPMHFERLVLAAAQRRPHRGGAGLGPFRREVTAVTGDDAAMAVMARGRRPGRTEGAVRARGWPSWRSSSPYPIDELGRSVQRAEQELASLRSAPARRDPAAVDAATSRATSATCTRRPHDDSPEPEQHREATDQPVRPISRETDPSRPPRAAPRIVRRCPREGRRRDQRLPDSQGLQGGGAGLSKWTFAERGRRQFFIKEFLSPTYPDDAAPGSEKTKAKKRARCAVFEAHHRGMQKALAPLSAYGGNLIVTLDFFRFGAKYYKVTEKVDAEDLGPAGVAGLGLHQQLVLMKSVAHSLKILHDLRIVHGDLKPSNILVKRTELGYTSKLIDFDSSYIAGSPPPADRDRRHHQLLLARAARLHPRGRRAARRARRRLRRLRTRSDLHRIPDRRRTAVRRGPPPRAGRRRPPRRDAADPAGRGAARSWPTWSTRC